MFELKKRMEIAGSHQLDLPYKSKCTKLHGHNWIITVYCRARDLGECNMIIDFVRIKDVVSKLDHAHLNDLIDQPTAERIAEWVGKSIVTCYRVDVEESEGNMASWIKDTGPLNMLT